MSSDSQAAIQHGLDPTCLPAHIAMIMDGNGRWARRRLLNRVRGHERGAETVRVMVRTCREFEIPILTLYAFSTENWQRPKSEVQALMALLKRFLVSEQSELLENGIRLSAIGRIDRLPASTRNTLLETMDLTRDGSAMLLNLALSYGGRDEIVEMARSVAAKVQSGHLLPEDIDSDLVSKQLFTRGMPDPDLLIRTSGEMRISNFLLWQIAYAEIFFTETLWPDFTREEFIEILKNFQKRDRRFGKV